VHRTLAHLKILQREVRERLFQRASVHFFGLDPEAVSGMTVEQKAFATEPLECAMNVVLAVKEPAADADGHEPACAYQSFKESAPDHFR